MARGSEARRIVDAQADARAPTDSNGSQQVLVHFYRAAVGHGDVWRQRLDATTNWAVVTTAAMITFAFGDSATPHFILLAPMAFLALFLFMESRRYQVYNRWQRRTRALHKVFIAPALSRTDAPSAEEIEDRYTWLARDLGRTVPRIGLLQAVGYRIRRNYGPLLTVAVLAWLLKLFIHPASVHSWGEYVNHAEVGLLPGWAVFCLVGLVFVAALVLAIKAPSEQMRDWGLLASPVDRLFGVEPREPISDS